MHSTDGIHGRMLPAQRPNWRPLLDLAPAQVGDFMWMFKVEPEEGAQIHAYKHRWTRRYLHLDREGRAFVYGENGRYREVAPNRLLDLVVSRHSRP